ncbi:zinc-binding alcohol dehydrogenase family protein [Adonisia turfae]|uniref:Zinc-type alcohol dehydrogenase-like protein n=1 Tax=Adonisia turfae CCMR0081 TaxID=2292702 RepID=A0A6M0RPY6_9CYAN|nr:zinc-binding alcohol dehydrogenase family protein [Adonisia turfae]NEZ57843.1 zinc-binding alcohol dehydrogenase family protein [Adonisia turfae CCMR0081]
MMIKAFGVSQFLPTGHPDCFAECFLNELTPGQRDLQVQVRAVSVNPIDCKMRASVQGRLITPKILGWDVAGVVTAVGERVTLFKPGDDVYYAGSIARQGCNSEYHLVDERIVGHKPRSLSFEESAALPLTTITAWESLFERLNISPEPRSSDATLLIIGGAGGVGSMAIQLAKYAGLRVIATASRDVSRKWCMQLGASHCVNHHENLRVQLERLEITAVDYILCLNDTNHYWQVMADVIKPQGSICAVVSAKEPPDLNLLKNKSVTFAWEFMFTKALHETNNMISQHQLLNQVAKLIDQGIVKSTMTEHLGPLSTATLARAHERLESGKMIGKLTLSGFEI